MVRHSSGFRFFFLLWISASAATLSHSDAAAQATLKKIRLGIAATSVGFLPIYTAYHRGFYKDEGIDLEIILMSLAAANNAFFKGEIDYSAGLTGLALAAVRNYPAKDLDLHRRQTAPVIRQSQRDQRATRSPGQESRRQLARRLGDHTCLSGAQTLRPRTRKRRYRHAHGGLRRGPVGRAWSRGWSMRRSSPCRKTSSPRKKAITS